MKPAVPQIRLLPAGRPAEGISRFRLAGLVGAEAVVADWDGSLLTVSQPLYARSPVLAAPGDGSRRFSVTELVLSLARSCDVVDVVEYSWAGRQRAVVAAAPGEAIAVDVADAGGPVLREPGFLSAN